VDAARARLQQTAAEEARYSGLVSSGAVSQSAYDQVKAASDSARALLSAAEAQLRVAQDEGAYATLAADADGTVMETLAEPGQFVSAGQIVVRVARAGAREAAVNLLRPCVSTWCDRSRHPLWRECRFGHTIPGPTSAAVRRRRSAHPDI